ncbi:NUDIX hydrolase [Candidatus Mycalebacterium sp.]
MFDELFIKTFEKNLARRPLRKLSLANGMARAAVMAIVRRATGGAEVCFIKRSRRPLDRFSGHIAFPGGAREKNDPDILATAIRETREETGMDIENYGKILGRLDDETPRPLGDADKNRREYLVSVFVCALFSDLEVPDPETWISDDEVEEIFWIPVSELRRGENPEKPEFFHRKRRIWGMTGRIVDKLLECIPPQA